MCEGKRVGHVTNTYPFAFDENADDIEPIGFGRPSMPVDPD